MIVCLMSQHHSFLWNPTYLSFLQSSSKNEQLWKNPFKLPVLNWCPICIRTAFGSSMYRSVILFLNSFSSKLKSNAKSYLKWYNSACFLICHSAIPCYYYNRNKIRKTITYCLANGCLVVVCFVEAWCILLGAPVPHHQYFHSWAS